MAGEPPGDRAARRPCCDESCAVIAPGVGAPFGRRLAGDDLEHRELPPIIVAVRGETDAETCLRAKDVSELIDGRANNALSIARRGSAGSFGVSTFSIVSYVRRAARGGGWTLSVSEHFPEESPMWYSVG